MASKNLQRLCFVHKFPQAGPLPYFKQKCKKYIFPISDNGIQDSSLSFSKYSTKMCNIDYIDNTLKL